MDLTRRGMLRGAVGAAAMLAAGCQRETAARQGAAARAPTPPSTSTPPPPAGSHPPPDRSAAPRRLPPQVERGPTDRGAVALTFHGAGDPGIARRLLDEAARGGARVTVLAVGTWLDEQPAMAREILAGGHELGNHTQHHGAISEMDEAAAYAEIAECAATLRRLTGSQGRWFRPSQAHDATGVVRAQAARAGYPTVVSYDVDSLDYTDPGPRAVTDAVLSGVGAGSIVSLHFGYDGTVRAMPALLAGLRQRGLRAVTVSDLLS